MGIVNREECVMSRLFVLTATLAAMSGSVAAHHSFAAEYDANNQMTVVGTITKVEWTNPHTWFFIDVKDAKGQIDNWAIEGGAPTVLYREGWKPTSLKAGESRMAGMAKTTYKNAVRNRLAISSHSASLLALAACGKQGIVRQSALIGLESIRF